jgi:hypothetical protein
LSSAFYHHFEERDRPKLLSQTAAFMPRRAKIGEAFSTKVAWLAIVRVTLSNPATSESRRLTKPPRHVGRSPNLPRRVQTGLPLASLEHAGSEKGEQLFYGHALACFAARHRRFARRDAGRR